MGVQLLLPHLLQGVNRRRVLLLALDFVMYPLLVSLRLLLSMDLFFLLMEGVVLRRTVSVKLERWMQSIPPELCPKQVFERLARVNLIRLG